MKRKRTNLSKIAAVLPGLVLCLALMLGILLAGPTNTSRAEEPTVIDSVGLSFNETNIGDKLVSMFNFEDAEKKTLKVPEGANYTAIIDVIFCHGHSYCLWKEAPGYLWSTIENSEITRTTPYVIRVVFQPKDGYVFDTSKGEGLLNTVGGEIGKGKAQEIWTSSLEKEYFSVDFVVTKGMNYMFNGLSVYPKIGEPVVQSLSTAYTDTGFWLVGAPGPYTFEAKYAPVGTIVETINSTIAKTSNCNYQITAVNAMDGGTMYITATAADGQTCDIPISVGSVEGGHEHTWVEELEQIGSEHHGYTRCTAEDCPGVAFRFDKGSGFSAHDFAYGCNVGCGTCGYVNPEGKHTYIWYFDSEDTEYHISRCRCGEVEKDESGAPVKEKHHGGKATCFVGAECDVCHVTYTEKTEHRFLYTNPDLSFSNAQFRMCYYCGTEDTGHRHLASGGTATCDRRAVCTHEGCGWEYGDFVPHTFVDGKCSVCGADEVVNRVVIEVPYWTMGTPVKVLEYPTIKEGRVFHAINSNSASYTRRDGFGGFLATDSVIEQTVVLRYNFLAQANCKINPNVNEMELVAENGEIVYKEYNSGSGYLTVSVLLRLDNTVSSVEIDVPQPYGGHDAAKLGITEKNGMEVTVTEWYGLSDYDRGNFVEGKNSWAVLKIKAPEGKKFSPTANQVNMWLGELHLSGAEMSIDRIDVNDEGTEATLRITLPEALPCPHGNVEIKEAGRPETCTEDGVKDKFVCRGCGKEFTDSDAGEEWSAATAILSAAHRCELIEGTDVTPPSESESGKDGNTEYYLCVRDGCGKLFSDATCTQEITLAETVIHDFRTDWSSNIGGHYHECKNCEGIRDETAHRPDRTEATEDDPVACLDCGYIITPALAHTHRTALVPAVEPTCRKEGSKAYYRCSGCEVKFEDAEATRPVTDESTLALPKAHSFGAWKDEVPATAETEGVRGHKDCVFCEKHFDENGAVLTDLTIAKLEKVEVTVAGGTGSGSYTEGDTVTVVADEPEEGKVFKGWQDAAGNLVSSDREYTFVAGGETRLTAVYENKPSGGGTGGEPSDPTDEPPEKTPEKEKEGLSGGAVAGIVVGSVAVAGLGGFSLFWFAFKKKTFAELLTMIRGIFVKK